MAGDPFASYQREYLALRAALQPKLDTDIPSLRGGAAPSLVAPRRSLD